MSHPPPDPPFCPSAGVSAVSCFLGLAALGRQREPASSRPSPVLGHHSMILLSRTQVSGRDVEFGQFLRVGWPSGQAVVRPLAPQMAW